MDNEFEYPTSMLRKRALDIIQKSAYHRLRRKDLAAVWSILCRMHLYSTMKSTGTKHCFL